MGKLTDKTCTDFAEALASNAPIPGGGGAAALVGALGAALCSMAGNFTVGKKKYAAYEEELREILGKAEELRRRLLELVDADAEAFEPLSRSYAIPKDDPSREERLEEATLKACDAPVKMVEACAEIVPLLARMREIGSPMLVSDVGGGAYLCGAAARAASVNVYVNTRTLKDRAAADELEARVEAALKACVPEAERIAASVLAQIKGEN